MAKQYFDKAFVKFFKELEKNNERDWFHANKKRYEEHVKKPFYSLVEDLIASHQKKDPDFLLEVKNAVFRINRDIRFSKDKSPYKLHVGAIVSPKGRKDMSAPGTYIQFGAKECWIGGGFYGPDKDNIAVMRAHILHNLDAVKKLKKDKTFLKYFPEGIKGDINKRLPIEFREAAEKEALIFNKSWYYMATIKTADILKEKNLIQFINKHEKAGAKWNAFFNEGRIQ